MTQDEIERVTKFFEEKTRTLLTAPLDCTRLVKGWFLFDVCTFLFIKFYFLLGVVSSQFSNCPSYMSKHKVQHREEPEEKKTAFRMSNANRRY